MFVRILPLLAILLAGCVTPRPFLPVNGDQVKVLNGLQAAQYKISSGQGDWGNVVINVWTEGVARLPKPSVVVRWSISNNSKDAVQLDLERTHLIFRGKSDADSYTRNPNPSSDPLVVPPGTEKTIPLSFLLPEKKDADTLKFFEIDWAVTGASQSYGRITRFERASTPAGRTGFDIGIGVGIGL